MIAYEFPEIMCPEVSLAFAALCRALETSANSKGVILADAALTWHATHGGVSGFNCIFSEGLSEDVANAMAAILIMDAGEADFEMTVPGVVLQ